MSAPVLKLAHRAMVPAGFVALAVLTTGLGWDLRPLVGVAVAGGWVAGAVYFGASWLKWVDDEDEAERAARWQARSEANARMERALWEKQALDHQQAMATAFCNRRHVVDIPGQG